MSREKENGRKKWDVAFIEAGRPLGPILLFAQGEVCPSLQLIPHTASVGVPNACFRVPAGVPAQGHLKSSAEFRQFLGPKIQCAAALRSQLGLPTMANSLATGKLILPKRREGGWPGWILARFWKFRGRLANSTSASGDFPQIE